MAELVIRGYEAQAREMLDALPMLQENLLIAKVFRAMWSAALPAEQVEQIACAMCSLQSVDLRPALTKLVRAKVLRSRRIAGRVFYEVNY